MDFGKKDREEVPVIDCNSQAKSSKNGRDRKNSALQSKRTSDSLITPNQGMAHGGGLLAAAKESA